MRNWNQTSKKLKFINKAGFLLYLWGIETYIFQWGNSPVWPSFYFTYEELKQTIHTISIRKQTLFLLYLWGIETLDPPQHGFLTCLVFTLPMRNWNFFKYIDLGYCPKVFTLPMRNWNIAAWEFSMSGYSCFYFTYEELKLAAMWDLDWQQAFLLYLWGIETGNTLLPIVRSSSFYFTYEELKRADWVCILFWLWRFLLYLWGIETICCERGTFDIA